MSRSNPERIKLKELTTGLHLVVITDAGMIKKDGVVYQTPSGETGIFVRFTTNENKNFDQDFFIGGEKENFFNLMCAVCQIDRSQPFKKESIGKRLWIGIKEVWDIDGEELVYNGEIPVVNHYIFQFFPFADKKPAVKGDPSLNPKNQASGAFLDYRQVEKKSLVEKLIPLENQLNQINLDIQTTILKAEKVKEPELAPDWDTLSDLEKKVVDKDRFISEQQNKINNIQNGIPKSPFDNESFGPPAQPPVEKKKQTDPEIDTFAFPKAKDPFDLPQAQAQAPAKSNNDANAPVDWTNF